MSYFMGTRSWRRVMGSAALFMLAAMAGYGQSNAAPAKKAPSKGHAEGITVHGHWTIEIRNPDGSLDKHVEFENGLGPGIGTLPGGAAFLSQLLSGQLLSNPNLQPGQGFTWWIFLLGNNQAVSLTPLPDDPCANVFFSTLGMPPACIITNSQLYVPSEEFGSAPYAYCGALPQVGCSGNLIVSPSTTSFQLTGSVQATYSGHIATVQTWVNDGYSQYQFTLRNLTTPAGCENTTIPAPANQTLCGIPVAANQTIGVTVSITFNSAD
jgi:hypothetical protein